MKKPIITAVIITLLLFLLAYIIKEQVDKFNIVLFPLLFTFIIVFLFNSYKLYKKQISLKKSILVIHNNV